jgi:hypothetical protein
MGERIDQFTNDLRDKLNAADNRLDHLKAQLENAGQETQDAIESKLNQAKADIEEQKTKVKDGQQRAKDFLAADLAETKQDIHSWKQNREIKKLEKRAERRENYAADTVLFAMAAIDEANVAILEALEARLDADDALATS